MISSLSVRVHGAMASAPDEASATPYRLSLGKDVFLSVLGTTLFFSGRTISSHATAMPTTGEISALDARTVNWFDRSATRRWSPGADTASDVTEYTAALLPLVPAILQFVHRRPRDGITVLVMYAEAFGINVGLTSMMKGLVQRRRPFLYNHSLTTEQKLEASGQRTSFFSGHTSKAFCGAVFLSTTFSAIFADSPLRYVVWPASMTLAATTGLLRYVAGRHFPSDILVGATAGAMTGALIPLLHRHGQIAVYPLGGPINGIGASFSF